MAPELEGGNGRMRELEYISERIEVTGGILGWGMERFPGKEGCVIFGKAVHVDVVQKRCCVQRAV